MKNYKLKSLYNNDTIELDSDFLIDSLKKGNKIVLFYKNGMRVSSGVSYQWLNRLKFTVDESIYDLFINDENYNCAENVIDLLKQNIKDVKEELIGSEDEDFNRERNSWIQKDLNIIEELESEDPKTLIRDDCNGVNTGETIVKNDVFYNYDTTNYEVYEIIEVIEETEEE